ncbi:MAG: hypothetical protein H7301_05955 [Cryobacterium sp.]|nr:hypothetical protein [Oligoflexia bacterium]
MGYRFVTYLLLSTQIASGMAVAAPPCPTLILPADEVARRYVPLVEWGEFSVRKVAEGSIGIPYPTLNLTISSFLYSVTISPSEYNEAHQIVLVIPAWSDSELVDRMKKMAVDCIKQLPLKNIDSVKMIRVNDRDSAETNAYWKSVYKNFTMIAALGGSGAIDIFPAGYDSFMHEFSRKGLIRHEYAHNVATKFFGGTMPPQDYIDAALLDAVPVSDYGTNSFAEDFAEAHRIYISSDGGAMNAPQRKKFKNRFEYLDRYYLSHPEGLEAARVELIESMEIFQQGLDVAERQLVVKKVLKTREKRGAFAIVTIAGAVILYIAVDAKSHKR